jgi:hypothetical protein
MHLLSCIDLSLEQVGSVDWDDEMTTDLMDDDDDDNDNNNDDDDS